MKQRILYIFTRTPLHVGAGSSVGAIDQPVQRERHTGFPIIPASSLKGSFADHWNESLLEDRSSDGRAVRVRVGRDGRVSDAAWLFGSDDAREGKAAAGALLFGEARLLAFPIRSVKGSFAWITSPLILHRAARDGVLDLATIDKLRKPILDEKSIYDGGKDSPLDIGGKDVLEGYSFDQVGTLPEGLAVRMSTLLPGDPVWQDIAARLVVLSDGMLSHFTKNACEVAQHVRIRDDTGTADPGGLFNQENVPSETMFYSVLRATKARLPDTQYVSKEGDDALASLEDRIRSVGVFQFGGDASTGLGYCTVRLD